jgi:hypothetical protein
MNIVEVACFVGLPSIVALVFLIGMPGCVPLAVSIGFGSAIVSLVVVIISGLVYRLFRGRLPQGAPVPIWATIAVLLSASLALYVRLHPLEHKHPPNKSEPTAVWSRHSFGAKADDPGSLRSQRRHELEAQPETFASRIVVAVAIHAASRRWHSFLR